MGKFGMTNRRAAVTYMFMDPSPPPTEKKITLTMSWLF